MEDPLLHKLHVCWQQKLRDRKNIILCDVGKQSDKEIEGRPTSVMSDITVSKADGGFDILTKCEGTTFFTSVHLKARWKAFCLNMIKFTLVLTVKSLWLALSLQPQPKFGGPITFA